METAAVLFSVFFSILFLCFLVFLMRWLLGTQRNFEILTRVEEKLDLLDAKLDASLRDLEAVHLLQSDADARITDIQDKVQGVRESLYDVMHTVGFKTDASTSIDSERG